MENFYLKSLLTLSFVFFLSLSIQPLIYGNNYNTFEHCYDANLSEQELASFNSSNCQTAPLLSCPSLYFGCPGESTNPSNTGWASAQPGDPGCIQPTLTYMDIVINNSACLYELHRKWIARYSDNTNPWLYSECTQIIILRDLSEPTIANCPNDLTVSLDSNCNAYASWNPPTANDNCGLLSFSSNFEPGDHFYPGINLVVYTAEDHCGNIEHCSFKITVVGSCCNDKTPVISCPADYDGCMSDSFDPANTGLATASYTDPSCPAANISYTDSFTMLSSCTSMGSIILRKWFAKNPNNYSLIDSCVQRIHLIDTIIPVIINCPVDTIVELTSGQDSLSVSWSPPVVTDNCSILSFHSDYLPGALFPIGTTTVSYIALDECSNQADCSFTITVRRPSCDTLPVINCPPNYHGCPGDDYTPGVIGYATAIAGDSLCETPLVKYKDHILFEGDCPGRRFVRRIWTAYYPSDSTLSTSCIQTINLRDTRRPDIYNCPIDTTVTSPDGNSVAVYWTIPDISDNCGIDHINNNFQPGDKFPIGTTMINYAAFDNCGNVRRCRFNITVLEPSCEDPPVLNCPPHYRACIGEDASPDNTGYATATAGSNLCDTPIISFQDDTLHIGPCYGRIIIDRTWTASDPNDLNLASSCVQKIRIRDYQAPSILNCPSDVTVSLAEGSGCFTTVSWIPPTANDNCGLRSFTSNYVPGDIFTEGTTIVEYKATDNCGRYDICSFSVTVECSGCNIAPTISCLDDYYGCPGDDISPDEIGYATAGPGELGCDIPILTFIDDTITAGPCPGIIEIDRIWTATDPNNWKIFKSCIQIIILEDLSSPTIGSCPADITVQSTNMSCTAAATWSSPVASDDCGILSFTSNYTSGDYFPLGTTTVIYSVVDVCGTEVICDFDVTVECNHCTQAPTIHCPSDGYGCPGDNFGPNVFGYATATSYGNNCDSPVITFDDLIVGSGPCSGAKLIERTWKASDPNNGQLFSTCLQQIHLKDVTAPELNNCPDDIIVWASGYGCSKYVSWNAPTYWDNCSSGYLTSNYNSGDLFNEGITQVIYTATDACGNSISCSFNVIVECNNLCASAPSIYCPNYATVCIGDDISPASTGYATAYNNDPNCPTPIITFEDILMNTGPCIGQKEIKRIWKASYQNYPNLQSTCDQWITVTDTGLPTFWDCPNNISVPSTNYIVSWIPPILTDDCSYTSVSSTHNPGDYFPPGTTTVYYYGQDACGNTATCSFTVTVGQPGNLLSCPDNITMDCDGTGGAYIDWNLPTYTGNCNTCISGDSIPGFVYMGEYSGHYYYCSTTQSSWPTANAVCQANGGYLASVSSAGENSFLANILTLQSAYIGLHDSNVEGNFQWSNGDPLIYTNWYPGQPNDYDYNQDYVEMLNNGQWNDQYNYKLLEYIMEIPCNSIQQIAGPTRGSYVQAGTYTIEYEILDVCGTLSRCDFTVTVAGNIHLTCPPDTTIINNDPNTNGVIFNWALPNASTCCANNCSAGFQIPGFVYMGQLQGHHYYCSIGADTWLNAEASCVALGGHLACIESQEENDFLTAQMVTQRAFIGLHDSNVEGTFEWVCGDPVGYTNWYTGQPNNYNQNQDYVEILSDGTWNDTYPDFLAEYILELPTCLDMTLIGGLSPGDFFLNNTTTTITYQVIDGCGNVETCSFDVTVQSNNCESGGYNSDLAHIEAVGVDQQWVKTGNNGGYIDLTNISSDCFKIEGGTTHTLGLVPGFSSGVVKDVFWKVWIDFNVDGDFEDSGEYIAYGSGSNALSGMVTIPNVNNDLVTVMRVAMKCGSYPTGPCEYFEYGETEDHCIYVAKSTFQNGDNVGTRSVDHGDAVILLPEYDDNIQINIYPNPASDLVNIQFSGSDKFERILLVDTRGSFIKEIDLVGEHQIDVSMLDSGYYFIQFLMKDGTIETKKLIVL